MHISIPSWLTGAVMAIVFSAAARALPDPLPKGSRLYLFLYRFAQNLLANFDKSARVRGE
jgi:hypothetical protein